MDTINPEIPTTALKKSEKKLKIDLEGLGIGLSWLWL